MHCIHYLIQLADDDSSSLLVYVVSHWHCQRLQWKVLHKSQTCISLSLSFKLNNSKSYYRRLYESSLEKRLHLMIYCSTQEGHLNNIDEAKRTILLVYILALICG